MSLHPLLVRFESIVKAPGNIQNLRKLAIILAVSGRLSEHERNGILQDGNERRIAPTKLLLKAGKHSRLAEAAPIDESELPSGFNSTAGFVRLVGVAKLDKGPTAIQQAKPGNYPLVTTAEVRSSCDHFDFDGRAAIIPLVSSTGHGNAALKRLHYQEGKFALGNILCCAMPISEDIITARFIFEYLTAFKNELLVSRMTGTANVTLTVGRIGEIPIPIISLKVQQSLDSFMTLCDQLEEAQRERDSRQDRLVAAAHYHLNNGTDAEALRSHIQFLMDRFPLLTARPDHIPALRQTILSLAVQGKLVQQNPEDDSSGSLLSTIRKIRAGTASRTKNSAVDDSDPKFVQHLPQSLPNGWIACPLEELFRFVDYRGRTPTRTTRGVRLITAKNVRMGQVANDPVEFIDDRAYKTWMTRGFPQTGDLLFVTEGATMGFVGTVEFQFVFALAQRTIDLQPYLRSCSRFFLFTLMSPIFQDAIVTNSTGTAVKGIKAAKLKRIRVPLPPQAEQHRIIAKVDELMALCDQLEARLTTAQNEARRLLESVLHHALQVSA